MSDTLFFSRHGDTANDTLVLLHSGGMAGVEWQPQIASLSEHFDLIVPDMMGHGQSLIPAGQILSVKLMGEAVIALLDSLGIEKIHLCGSSLGGAVSLWIALNYSQYVEKLIIYRIGYTKNQETHEQTTAMANPEYWRQYGMHRWLSKLHEPQDGEDAWENVIANVSRVLDPATSQHNHSLDDLRAIQSPTLLIAGDRDPLIPVSTVLDMYEAIPESSVWIMPNAAHITASNTWRAKAFADELIRFLN